MHRKALLGATRHQFTADLATISPNAFRRLLTVPHGTGAGLLRISPSSTTPDREHLGGLIASKSASEEHQRFAGRRAWARQPELMATASGGGIAPPRLVPKLYLPMWWLTAMRCSSARVQARLTSAWPANDAQQVTKHAEGDATIRSAAVRAVLSLSERRQLCGWLWSARHQRAPGRQGLSRGRGAAPGPRPSRGRLDGSGA